MSLASGLRRFSSLAVVVALSGGCEVVVPAADTSPVACKGEKVIGQPAGCDDNQICLTGLCRVCNPVSCPPGAGGAGPGGAGGDGGNDEGGAAGDDSVGGEAGSSAGKAGQAGAGNQGGDAGDAGDGGDAGTAGAAGDAGAGGFTDGGSNSGGAGTKGGTSGEGGQGGAMSGSSGQSGAGVGGTGTAGSASGMAGTSAGSSGAGGAPPVVAKMGEDCTASNVTCEDKLLCINLAAWDAGPDTQYICTQPCCQSGQCGDAAGKSVCLPTTAGGGMCLPSSYGSRSSTLGTKLGGEACPGGSSDCRSGLCEGGICSDLCCQEAGCHGSTCRVSTVTDSSITALQCVAPVTGLGKAGDKCGEDTDISGDDSKCTSGVCVGAILVGWKCGKPCQRQLDCSSSGYICDYVLRGDWVRVCKPPLSGGDACAANANCGSGYCVLDSDQLLVCKK